MADLTAFVVVGEELSFTSYRTMEAGMPSEQVYWVFTVTVDG